MKRAAHLVALAFVVAVLGGILTPALAQPPTPDDRPTQRPNQPTNQPAGQPASSDQPAAEKEAADEERIVPGETFFLLTLFATAFGAVLIVVARHRRTATAAKT